MPRGKVLVAPCESMFSPMTLFRKIEGLHDQAMEEEEESLEEKKKIFIESMMASDYDKDVALAAWNTIKNKDKKTAGAIEEEG